MKAFSQFISVVLLNFFLRQITSILPNHINMPSLKPKPKRNQASKLPTVLPQFTNEIKTNDVCFYALLRSDRDGKP